MPKTIDVIQLRSLWQQSHVLSTYVASKINLWTVKRECTRYAITSAMAAVVAFSGQTGAIHSVCLAASLSVNFFTIAYLCARGKLSKTVFGALACVLRYPPFSTLKNMVSIVAVHICGYPPTVNTVDNMSEGTASWQLCFALVLPQVRKLLVYFARAACSESELQLSKTW